MGTILIRCAELGDVDAIANMMRALANFHGDETLITAEDLKTYSFGEDKLAHVWVASLDNACVGFALIYDRMNFVRGNVTRTLDLLFVDEAARQKGIGKALVMAVAKDTLAKKFGRLVIGADPSNKVSNQFYQNLGLTSEQHLSSRYVVEGHLLEKMANGI